MYPLHPIHVHPEYTVLVFIEYDEIPLATVYKSFE